MTAGRILRPTAPRNESHAELTAQTDTGKVSQVAPAGLERELRRRARVMFENSTVCHAIYVVVIVCAASASLVWVFVGFWQSNDSGDELVCLFAGFEFFMESLILAQDERWRRA